MHCGWLLTVLVSTLLLVEMMQPAEGGVVGRNGRRNPGGRRNGSPCRGGGVWRNGRCSPGSRGGSTGRDDSDIGGGADTDDDDDDGPIRPGLRPSNRRRPWDGDDEDDDAPVRPGLRGRKPSFDDDDDEDDTRPVRPGSRRPGSRRRRPNSDDSDGDSDGNGEARRRCRRGKKGCKKNNNNSNKKKKEKEEDKEPVDVSKYTAIENRGPDGIRNPVIRGQKDAGMEAINVLQDFDLSAEGRPVDQGRPRNSNDHKVRIDSQNAARLDEDGVQWANVQIQLNNVPRGTGGRSSTTIAQATVPVGASLAVLKQALTASLQNGVMVQLAPE